MGSSRLSGRKSKKSSGAKSVSYYEKALESKKIKLIPEKKKLKSQIANSTGAKKKAAERSLANLEKAQKKHRQIKDKKIQEKREWMRKNKTQDRDAVREAFARATTTTYERFRKRQAAKVAEFFGYK